MHPLKYTLLFVIAFVTAQLNAQAVETLAGPNPRINNGLVVAPNGDIYASDLFGTGFNGSSISRITPTGQSEVFATGLSQPAGLAIDNSGLLYVAEFTSGEISTVNAEGEVLLFASGFKQPADLVFDKSSNLYVSNHNGGSISKIASDGTVSTFTTGLNKPVGLAYHNDLLYSVNLNDGKLYQIDSTGNKTLLTTLTHLPVGFMTFADNHLYVASTGGHRIYQIALDGETVVLSGNGRPATTNGELSKAQFTNPDGISASPTGDTLYVSENNTHRLRRILLKSPSNLEPPEPENKPYINIHPSPANTHITVSFYLDADDFVSIHVLGPEGALVKQLIQTNLAKGTHEFWCNTKTYEPGLYFVRVISSEFQSTVPLLVMR